MKSWVLAVLAAGAICIAPAAAQDKHAGYYYPVPKSEETYTARARTLPESDRGRHLGFIVGFMAEMAKEAVPQRYVLFAKGTEAEKLIIVGLALRATLFRARAVLATLTSRVRASPLFAELDVQDFFMFYDLAKLIGFKQITVSDGRTWAHRVWVK